MVGLSKADHMVRLHVALLPIGDGDGDDGDVALANLTTCHAKGTLIYEIHFACDVARCYVEGLRGRWKMVARSRGGHVLDRWTDVMCGGGGRLHGRNGDVW